MLEIKTPYGNFSRYKDLYLFMIEKGLKSIKVDTHYVFDKVNSLELTLDEVITLAE